MSREEELMQELKDFGYDLPDRAWETIANYILEREKRIVAPSVKYKKKKKNKPW